MLFEVLVKIFIILFYYRQILDANSGADKPIDIDECIKLIT